MASAPAPRQPARGQFEIDMDFWGNSASIDADIEQMLADPTPGTSRVASQGGGLAVESLQGLWNTEGAEELLDPSYGSSSGNLDSIWAQEAAEERQVMAAMGMSRMASNNEISFDNEMDAELAGYRPPQRAPIGGPRIQVGQAGRYPVVTEAPRPARQMMSREEARQIAQSRLPPSFREQVAERQAAGRPAPVEVRPSALARATEYASKPSAWDHLRDDDEG
jgi:hypothetical protein